MTSPMLSLIDETVRYDLAESTCPPLTTGELGVLPDLTLGYGTSPGSEQLRELIAADSGVRPDQVLVTVGGIEAMFLLAQVVGGRVLLVTPCFPPARSAPEAVGAEVDVVKLSFDDGYRLPPIAAALTPQTRLVSLASPQNPSGVRFTDAELRRLLAEVTEYAPDAVVLIDETYRASTYDGLVPPSTAGLSPRVVTCSSLSKAHGAPGLRIGWLTTTDPELYERLRELKFLTTVACSNVDEYLATEVFRRREPILAARTEHLRRGLDEVVRWSREQRFELVVPDGGALCCVRLPGPVGDFYERLATFDARVAPGSWFGEDDRVFRVGFGHLPIDDLRAALDAVAHSYPVAERVE
ncbi:pyridoxal phosphate-dependent aminotransferase [Cryptosporangium arvum]|uniref:pyridoxal phosphate-dependent aminotransferase n=1 Tax=Cryptosporangium arvum TaxID=80871 RepID=UPI0004AE7AE7|nr:pyridoxal phosphate-dependent aminotransferase [Cryptosporangium arvum]